MAEVGFWLGSGMIDRVEVEMVVVGLYGGNRLID